MSRYQTGAISEVYAPSLNEGTLGLEVREALTHIHTRVHTQVHTHTHTYASTANARKTRLGAVFQFFKQGRAGTDASQLYVCKREWCHQHTSTQLDHTRTQTHTHTRTHTHAHRYNYMRTASRARDPAPLFYLAFLVARSSAVSSFPRPSSTVQVGPFLKISRPRFSNPSPPDGAASVLFASVSGVVGGVAVVGVLAIAEGDAHSSFAIASAISKASRGSAPSLIVKHRSPCRIRTNLWPSTSAGGSR
mmetsp:Transcript_21990/g.48017  ORF Transcript_21990/g.48017 Transcript_21990/m.48017 type:complete len:248 (+) Transcript_21990:122-865(+)